MYLVTGGAGFIGSNIVGELLRRGHRVRVLDDLSNGLASNLEDFGDDVDFLHGDIRDPAAVERAVAGVEVVFHLAALGSVPRSIADPAATNAVNVAGTVNVLVAARKAGARRLVFSSSSSVYGNTPVTPKTEALPYAPVSPYAVSKMAAESYTRVFSQIYDMETVCLRYFNVFGPKQRPDAAYAAVIPKFMHWAISGEALEIHGDGQQSRDFTYVDNVVSANLLAADAPGVSGQVFNCACGESYSLLDIVEALERALGRGLERKHSESRPGDIRKSLAGIDAARKSLGYEVLVPFSEGLARTWEKFCTKHSMG